jgi:hypothetical protein
MRRSRRAAFRGTQPRGVADAEAPDCCRRRSSVAPVRARDPPQGSWPDQPNSRSPVRGGRAAARQRFSSQSVDKNLPTKKTHKKHKTDEIQCKKKLRGLQARVRLPCSRSGTPKGPWTFGARSSAGVPLSLLDIKRRAPSRVVGGARRGIVILILRLSFEETKCYLRLYPDLPISDHICVVKLYVGDSRLHNWIFIFYLHIQFGQCG